MLYKELFKNSSDSFYFLSLATTGIKDDSELIGVWVSDEHGAVTSVLCKGIDITVTQQYHRIPEGVYDTEALDKEAFQEKAVELLKGKYLLGYSLPFTKKFLAKGLNGDHAIDLHSIGVLENWVRTNQVVPDQNTTLSEIRDMVSAWSGFKELPIRKSLTMWMPSWVSAASLPEPYALVQGMAEMWKLMGECQVPLLRL